MERTTGQGDTIRIHYTGRLHTGEVFDSSLERDPLEFTLGAGQVIPGFEEGSTGLSLGQKVTVRIPAEKAYGVYQEELIFTVPKHQFPESIAPEVGQKFQVPLPQGGLMTVRIAEIADESIALDANHELAGKELIFDIELIEIL